LVDITDEERFGAIGATVDATLMFGNLRDFPKRASRY
jgi:hypothetical protein